MCVRQRLRPIKAMRPLMYWLCCACRRIRVQAHASRNVTAIWSSECGHTEALLFRDEWQSLGHAARFLSCCRIPDTVSPVQVLPPYRDRECGILPPLAVPPSPGQSPLTFPGRAVRGRAMPAALDISGFRPEPGKAMRVTFQMRVA